MSSDNADKPTTDVATKALDNEAVELLRDPNLLGRIQKILHEDMLSMQEVDLGIIRENLITLYLFLIALSSKPLRYEMRDTPKEGKKLIPLQRMSQMVVVKGDSRSGKTRICNTIFWYFKTKVVGETSAKFLNYVNLDEYDILYLQELFNKDSEGEGDQLRLMSTEDGGYTVGIVMPSEKSGGFMPIEKKVNPIVVATTTTRPTIEAQLGNRSHITNTDESEKQTKAIADGLAKRSKLKFLRKTGKIKSSNEPYVLKRAIELLDRDVDVANTCSESLNLLWPTFQNTRIRSDIKKLDALVCLSAFLHQHQRPYVYDVENGKRIKTVFVTPQDYYYILELIRDSLATMYSNLESRQRELVPFLNELRKKKTKDLRAGGDVEGFTVNDARAMLTQAGFNLNRKTLERRLDALVSASILEVFKSGRENIFKVAVSEKEINGLLEIGRVFETSNEFLQKAVAESRATFELYKSEHGDNFKMPSENAFEVFTSPQWFNNDYTGDYKVVSGSHDAELLGTFGKSSDASSHADHGAKFSKLSVMSDDEASENYRRATTHFSKLPRNRITGLLLKRD